MYVAVRKLHDKGITLPAGSVIPDFENWPVNARNALLRLKWVQKVDDNAEIQTAAVAPEEPKKEKSSKKKRR